MTSTSIRSPFKGSLRAIRRRYRRVRSIIRRIERHLRVMPDFIIIGAQKCGTTALYDQLCQHPRIIPATTKEVNFFDEKFGEGAKWYRSHFPLGPYMYYQRYVRSQEVITGEASTNYIFYPHVPARVRAMVPDAKLIALLRNPVDRAYSHYQHGVKRGGVHTSFEVAIEQEETSIFGEKERMIADENYYSWSYQAYSYKSKGIYVDQLEVWSRLFPRENILILKSEDYFDDPSSVFRQVLDFLHLPTWEPEVFKASNVGCYQPMNSSTRKFLHDFFRPHNERLYKLLGTDLGWDNDEGGNHPPMPVGPLLGESSSYRDDSLKG